MPVIVMQRRGNTISSSKYSCAVCKLFRISLYNYSFRGVLMYGAKPEQELLKPSNALQGAVVKEFALV